MPVRTLMGGETEYAIGATDARGESIPQAILLRRFMEFARHALPYTSVSDGRFFSNGGLLYLDSGLHIEWASPECASPHDVVRYLRAGDRIVHTLASEFARASPDVVDVFCTRCNVDYLERTLWASHESYLHWSHPARLPGQLIPFLASRVVLSGVGGWDHRSPGASFVLSPRAGFITEVAADNTQEVRPIFSTKDEVLSDTGSHRLHVACSETLCSDLALLLRFGTTALIVALIDDGGLPGDRVRLQSPLMALRRFAKDPRCRARATLANRRRVRAIDIQRHYLSAVEERLGTAAMPHWAESVCQLWRQALDTLEIAPEKMATSLDWAIKQRVFADYLRRRGIEWSSLPALNSALLHVRRALVARGQRLDVETLRQSKGPCAEAIRELPPAADGGEITGDQMAVLLSNRQRLFEIDMRFGQLGDHGIFDTLDRAGVLDHRVAGADAIETALDAPPHGTRATVRGDVVRRLTESRTRYCADWMRVVDMDHRRELDLSDPFEAEERWRSLNAV